MSLSALGSYLSRLKNLDAIALRWILMVRICVSHLAGDLSQPIASYKHSVSPPLSPCTCIRIDHQHADFRRFAIHDLFYLFVSLPIIIPPFYPGENLTNIGSLSYHILGLSAIVPSEINGLILDGRQLIYIPFKCDSFDLFTSPIQQNEVSIWVLINDSIQFIPTNLEVSTRLFDGQDVFLPDRHLLLLFFLIHHHAHPPSMYAALKVWIGVSPAEEHRLRRGKVISCEVTFYLDNPVQVSRLPLLL